MIKTIKGKIVLWYGISAFCIILVSGIILISSITQMTGTILNERLHNTVGLFRINLLFNNSFQLAMDERALDGVKILIYTPEGEFLKGDENSYIQSQQLVDHRFKALHVDNKIYYIYDELIKKGDAGQYWVRAYFVFDAIIIWKKTITNVTIYLMPILLVLTIGGGLFIARSAFAPINKMRNTVKEITESVDLNRRIELNNKNHDELTVLADTFNKMFDKIESLFMQEKQVTSDASHELRTPVSVILAQAEYLMEQLDELDNQKSKDELIETTDVIIRQTKRLQKIINDLLMVARMENKNFYVEKESIDFSEMLEMIVEEMKEVADKRNIEIRSSIPNNVSFQSNESLLIRVLINLISNAIKYGRDNGWVQVTVREEADQIICMIEDNGIGIASENLDKIWNRFYMVDKSRRYEEESTGLGLFLVRHIVEHLDGYILVDSKLGEGSCFTIHFRKS